MDQTAEHCSWILCPVYMHSSWCIIRQQVTRNFRRTILEVVVWLLGRGYAFAHLELYKDSTIFFFSFIQLSVTLGGGESVEQLDVKATPLLFWPKTPNTPTLCHNGGWKLHLTSHPDCHVFRKLGVWLNQRTHFWVTVLIIFCWNSSSVGKNKQPSFKVYHPVWINVEILTICSWNEILMLFTKQDKFKNKWIPIMLFIPPPPRSHFPKMLI